MSGQPTLGPAREHTAPQAQGARGPLARREAGPKEAVGRDDEAFVSDAEALFRARVDALMERVADGDDQALGELCEQLGPRLRRFALRWTRSAEDADDVVQHTMLQILKARARFARGAHVLPWAYAIARNLLRDQEPARSRRAKESEMQEDERVQPGPPQDVALHLTRLERLAEAALQRLDARLRDAFVLVNVEGLPVAEAASVLGISVSNCKVRAFRARARLLEMLGEL
jgi:RNA polymerase sigma-70 factor (ECF subfamily)